MNYWLSHCAEVTQLLNGYGVNIEAVLVGGSQMKGFGDKYSDIDLCAIVQDGSQANCFSVPELRHKKQVHICHLFSMNKKSDLRIVEKSKLMTAIERWDSLADITYVNQDLLFNIKHGKYYSQSPWVIRCVNKITFREDHKSAVISENIRLIRDYGFRRFVARQDKLMIYETLNTIYMALINITYALNESLFMGYKHIKKIEKELPIFPTEAVKKLEKCYVTPSEKLFLQSMASIDHFVHQYIDLT